MASFKDWMIAHAPVVTDERTSGGWIGWMPAKMSPATKAAKPLQRMRLDAVIFILLSSLNDCGLANAGQYAYSDLADKEAIADGLNPLTMSQMASDSSQRNSGAAGRVCHAEPISMIPSITAIPEAMTRGPPTSPSMAMPRGTSLERYIK